MDISLFAASIRPEYWDRLLSSLKSNTVKYEVIFAGFIEADIVDEIAGSYPEFKYIQTANIKPAQCYEITRRECTGNLIGWISDDCVFDEKALDKICEFYPDPWAIIALHNYDPLCPNNDLNNQRFFSRNLNTPQMANYGFMSRDRLIYLGGFDNRYIYGKFECDICMRHLKDGGTILKFEETGVQVNHTNKNGLFNNDWSGVNEDSETLENSWVIGGYKDFEKPIIFNHPDGLGFYYPISNQEVTFHRNDRFVPYHDTDILVKSQGLNIPGRWV